MRQNKLSNFMQNIDVLISNGNFKQPGPFEYFSFSSQISEINAVPIDFIKLRFYVQSIEKPIDDQKNDSINHYINNVIIPFFEFSAKVKDAAVLTNIYQNLNKFIKLLISLYGINDFLLENWAKLFVFNGQFLEGYELFHLANLYYQNIQNRIVFIPAKSSPLYVKHMEEILNVLNKQLDGKEYIKNCGGNPEIIPQKKLS